MPKKIQVCSMAHLTSVPLPAHGASYTIISHQFVIDYSKQQLQAAGFSIVDEEYRCTADGQIAQGVYRLNFNSDPELSMMFAWTNSYNKQVKFKCLVGAYINQTGAVMTSGDIGTWTRKHTGTADTETKEMIDSHIQNAHMYYTQLVSDKATMEGMSLNKRRQAQMLGILFAEYQILTTEQASMVRQQMDRPSFVFNSSDSLWAFYNYVTIALQHSHPRTWMEDQRVLHYFIGTVCNFSAPVQPVSAPAPVVSAPVDPLENNYGEPENQTNLLVQIAEETGDDSVLKPTESLKETNPDLHHSLAHLAKAESDMLVLGDISSFEKIKEVTEQAMKDELIFGVSGVEVSADGLRNVPIEEVLKKMQEKDPMPDMIVHTEELTKEEVLEKYGDVLTEEQMESINSAGTEILDLPEEVEIVDKQVEVVEPTEDTFGYEVETIHYTDPAGNTFEAPVVPPCMGHDAETEKDLEEEIRETEVQNFLQEVEPEVDFSLPDENSLAPSPADYEMMEAIEYSEGIPAVADLDEIPGKEDDDFNFDLDVSDDTEDDGNIPDFF